MLIIEILYFLSATSLAIFGFHNIFVTAVFARQQRRIRLAGKSSLLANPIQKNKMTDTGHFPSVTVQLPIYNEQYVVERLIAAAAALDWPSDRLEIQVLDDSTDNTFQIVADAIETHMLNAVPIQHIRRDNRTGFKAGALNKGLDMAKGEFVAILDADFAPKPDFLKNAMAHFNVSAGQDPVGCVQTRWGHVNPNYSLLTRAQALGIDGHFLIEQTSRSHLNAYLNFNGTAGIWRKACIEDAGGWQHDTLTEDLDLSYRAQLNGWRILYQPEIVVPAELPVQLNAFKSQQFRWAKGSFQTAIKLLPKVWRAPGKIWRKVMATIHLTNYIVHPLLLLNLLLTYPISQTNSLILYLFPLVVLSAIGPSIMYITAARLQSIRRGELVKRLAIMILVGIGLSVSNTRAIFEAIFGIQSPFKRTPKFAVTQTDQSWQQNSYVLPRDPVIWLEFLFGLYSAGLLTYALMNGMYAISLWLILYTLGYAYLVGLALWQSWQLRSFSPTLGAQGAQQ